MTIPIRVPEQQWGMLHVYKVFWPSEFKVKIAGEIIELANINLFPPDPTEQIKLMDIDKNIRSEYNGPRDPTMG